MGFIFTKDQSLDVWLEDLLRKTSDTKRCSCCTTLKCLPNENCVLSNAPTLSVQA